MNVTILAANGQIAHLVEDRILNEAAFKDVNLALMLRRASRLANLAENPRVTVVEGDLTNPTDVIKATKDADLVWSQWLTTMIPTAQPRAFWLLQRKTALPGWLKPACWGSITRCQVSLAAGTGNISLAVTQLGQLLFWLIKCWKNLAWITQLYVYPG